MRTTTHWSHSPRSMRFSAFLMGDSPSSFSNCWCDSTNIDPRPSSLQQFSSCISRNKWWFPCVLYNFADTHWQAVGWITVVHTLGTGHMTLKNGSHQVHNACLFRQSSNLQKWVKLSSQHMTVRTVFWPWKMAKPSSQHMTVQTIFWPWKIGQFIISIWVLVLSIHQQQA